jgi:hypothetical protein
MVTCEYQLDIVDTPVSALPLWSTRSLLVGLPLLQCLSSTRFQCTLARRLGQRSRRSNRLLNWLYSLRSIWPRYREQRAGTDHGSLVVRTMFTLYAPVYTAFSTVAARQDELRADSYAMELFSDEDVLDAITTDAVYRLFLRERYWPAINKLQQQDATAAPETHAGMVKVLHAGVQAGNVVQWIEQAMSAEQQWDDPWPLLVRRIENIGHLQAGMNTGTDKSAAVGYLAISGMQLAAALADLPPPQPPRLQPWPVRIARLRRALQSAVRNHLNRLRNQLHSGRHAGEMRH